MLQKYEKQPILTRNREEIIYDMLFVVLLKNLPLMLNIRKITMVNLCNGIY